MVRIVDIVRPWGNLNVGSVVPNVQNMVNRINPSIIVSMNWKEDTIDATRNGKTVTLATGMEMQEVWHKFMERLYEL